MEALKSQIREILAETSPANYYAVLSDLQEIDPHTAEEKFEDYKSRLIVRQACIIKELSTLLFTNA